MNALTSIALILQDAAPAEPAGAEPFLGGLFVPVLVIMGLFYVLMLGPERKQRKKREAMLASMKKGQKVMTTGGMYGTIGAVSEDVITLIISDGVRVRFSRSAIQGLAEEEKPAKEKNDKEVVEAEKGEPVKA